jgi:hypothetical protein
VLLFIIPVKRRATSTSWVELSRLFDLTLRSVCAQTSPEFRVLVVCNERPDTTFEHPNVDYLEVDFPSPGDEYGHKTEDRARRVVAGLLATRDLGATHMMSVDADDRVSRRIAEHVAAHPDRNGWFVDAGYEYVDGADRITFRPSGFNTMCGTCNILRTSHLTLPDRLEPYEQMSGYDRFLSGHPHAVPDLAAAGTPIEPLPFPGAVYVRDRVGESITMQEPMIATLRRNPRELVRGLKKRALAPFRDRPLTDDLRAEFGL